MHEMPLGKSSRRAAALFIALCLGTLNFASAQSKKGQSENVRTVQGTVSDTAGAVVVGAVVQLKNKKTLQIRSFITKERGEYFFTGLSPDVDYEVKAESQSQGTASGVRTVSAFDSRKIAIMNLKLAAK